MGGIVSLGETFEPRSICDVRVGSFGEVHTASDESLVGRNDLIAACCMERVIIQPPLYNPSQPSSRFADRPVHPSAEFRFNLVECCSHAFARTIAMDGKPAVCSGLGTHMCETKETERLRSALPTSFSLLGRITAELDQTRFPFVQFQAKLGKPRVEFFQTRRCLAVFLEADHEVIRISNHNHIAAAAVFPPPLDPQVKHVVQVHVGKQR